MRIAACLVGREPECARALRVDHAFARICGILMAIAVSTADSGMTRGCAGGGPTGPQPTTPQFDCFAETIVPHPADKSCLKGIDSFPCIDTLKRGDAKPDVKVRCGWKRPTRTSIGGWCGRPQLLKYCD